MKKRGMALLMAVTMLTAILAGCGSTPEANNAPAAATAETPVAEVSVTESEAITSEEATAETESEAASEGELLASIKASGKLVVGTASGYPPYEFVDITSPSQEVIGIDMELAKAIADELGVELEIQDMNFSALLTSLPAHKIDLAIAGINPTDERRETMDFSDNYLEAKQAIIVLKSEADNLKTLEDFAGKTLTAQKATTQETLCQEVMTESPLVSLDKVPDAILEVINGKAAGCVVESVVGTQYILTNDELTFSEADFDRPKYSAVALEKGNEDLLEIINKVIQENKDNGNFDKWVTEYSEKAASNAQ